ncbi:Sodium/hydrogen exchanger family-domain-containing protein [Cantharellus anzutake]|uniref:Sodium/hydrogen exchanger family-domain-containing protein n=1 Tax=Cantharellus anzutake TaxID=1750568 RepID=UPI0019086B74|nr:Sodium/hydrogen exchanger family-domain-containing protein [Cantharellus anzutake]KAF8340357.1 Sodium/hydrogen exchanger family-domain-containing protein [Cantharellus anzutake]
MTLAKDFHPIDAHPFHVGYSVLAAFIVVFGMFSLFSKEKLYVGEAVWATIFGILIGPHCAGIFNPRDWSSGSLDGANTITIEVTRIVLAVGVFAVGVELPKAYVGRHWKSLTFLLVPVMTFGWFVCGALIYALIPKLDFLSSLVIAACLTPTDPILAAAVVGGRYAEKHVPTHLRHLLAAEAGVNDGAAFPMLFIALYLIFDRSDAVAVGHWLYITWAYEIFLGTILGALLGYSARHLMKFCEKHDLIDRQSYVAQYISLALLSNGITSILGSDDLLASFACGTAFAYDGWFNRKTEESMFSNVIDLLFNCACFVYIGAWIPFSDFNYPEVGITPGRLVIISVLVLLLRRLPIVVALYKWIPDIRTFREAVFSGYFGPMGVGAIFISTLAVEEMPAFRPEPGHPPETQLELLSVSIQPIVSFIVLCSIAVHGLSIPFFSLGRRVHSISRTWSRHTSMDPSGQPEWTTQARRITRPGDIVINHDPEDVQRMERGELTTVFGSGMSSDIVDEKKGNFSDDVVAAGESLGQELGDSVQEDRKTPPGDASASDGERQRDEVTEWREGKDLIIERAVGDGEEVEVEVVKNAFDNEKGAVSHILRGVKENVRHHVQNELGKVISVEDGLLGHEPLKHQERNNVQSSSDESPSSRIGVEIPQDRTPVEGSREYGDGEDFSPASSSPLASRMNAGMTETCDQERTPPSGDSPSGSTPARSGASSPTGSPRRPPVIRPSVMNSRRTSFRRRLFARPKHLHIKSPGRLSSDDDEMVEASGEEESERDEREDSSRETESAPDSPVANVVAPGVRMLAEEGRTFTSSTGIPMERSLSVNSVSSATPQTPGESSGTSTLNPIILRQRLTHLDEYRSGHRRSESPSSRAIRFVDDEFQRAHQHRSARGYSSPRGSRRAPNAIDLGAKEWFCHAWHLSISSHAVSVPLA